jgi:uncharacterized protein
MSRDRDPAGRPRNARPRDALGRPLPRTSAGRSPVDEPALPPPEALARSQELLDAGEAFAAHEVLEAVWKATTGQERALWRGLAQLCVGLTHVQRANLTGATALFARAADTLEEAPSLFGVDPAALAGWARRAADAPDAARPPRLAASPRSGR